MRRSIPVLIVVLALVGMADSGYLTLLHLHIIKSQPAGAADFCLFVGGGCEAVEQTSEATILGIPTAVLGVAYFTVLLGAAMVRLRMGNWPYVALLEVLLSIGLLFSGYLVFVLLFVFNLPCPFCLAAHSANALIVVLYAISRRVDRSHRIRRRRWAAGFR